MIVISKPELTPRKRGEDAKARRASSLKVKPLRGRVGFGSDDVNALSEQVIGCAIQVHQALGPGFAEKMYSKALAYELKQRRLSFVQEQSITVKYADVALGAQRLDFVVEDTIILEVKAVYDINNFHLAQILSYLRAADKQLGLVFNFSRPKLQIKRVVHGL